MYPMSPDNLQNWPKLTNNYPHFTLHSVSQWLIAYMLCLCIHPLWYYMIVMNSDISMIKANHACSDHT